MRVRSASFLMLFALVVASLPLMAQENPEILPAGLAFGYLPSGSTNTQVVSVYNVGTASMTVTAVTPSLSEFTVIGGPIPVTLSQGQRADYTVQFLPATAKAYSGTLKFTVTGGSSQSVTLSGNGTNTKAVPVLNTSSLTFAPQALGTTSPAQTLTITNEGTTSVSLTNVIVTYPYQQTGWTASTAIAPGKSLSLQVTYMPTVVTSQPGTISLTYNVAPPAGVALWGSGVAATAMGIDTFPTLPSGTQGYAYEATLNATGGTAPYTWTVASGSTLPTGLSLSSAGIITGTIPSSVALGKYSFTVTATDSSAPPNVLSVALTLPVDAYVAPQDCNTLSWNASDGSGPLVPISDLGTNYYLGAEQGGLYADGSNTDDSTHGTYGPTAASQIVPLNSEGVYSPTGKEVFISIGLSLAQQPFTEFLELVNTDPAKNPNVVVVNGATGGATASLLAGVNSNFWNAMIYDYLPNAGVTPSQVEAAWVLDVNGGPSGTFPSDMTNLQKNLQTIAENLLIKFPNIKVAYYTSPNYTGYSNGVKDLDPEPYSYESGFAVKNAIQDQIGGDSNMNYNPADGKVKAPWIAWGPYQWANGMIPRSDGLVWTCQDLDGDGTHPSDPVGRIKVSTQLLNFLKTDPTASLWFLAPGSPNSKK
jgi:hypothetical protein